MTLVRYEDGLVQMNGHTRQHKQSTLSPADVVPRVEVRQPCARVAGVRLPEAPGGGLEERQEDHAPDRKPGEEAPEGPDADAVGPARPARLDGVDTGGAC